MDGVYKMWSVWKLAELVVVFVGFIDFPLYSTVCDGLGIYFARLGMICRTQRERIKRHQGKGTGFIGG